MKDVLDKLKKDLETLEYEYRVELPREIKTAVAMGDLRENAEYHAALERQAFVRARIGELRERLAALRSIDLTQVPRDRAAIGSRLALLDLDTDAEVVYQLVFAEVADSAKGLLSISSPVGKALVGLREGDEVTVTIPAGKRRFEVLGLKTVHDPD